MTSLLPLSLSSSFFRSPFTRQSLQSIAQHLAMPISSRQIPSDWNPRPPTRKGLSGEAAVLIPLLNLADRVDTSRSFRSGTLLQVRPGGMRMHAGEVSFPGGKCDPSDSTLYSTALREAHEELGIHPSQVEYIGRLKLRTKIDGEETYIEDGEEWDDGPIRSLGGLRVWAFVGFIHPPTSTFASSTLSHSPTDPLPSLPLDSLQLSIEEVLHVIPLPFSHLTPSLSSPSQHQPEPNIVRRRLRKQVTSDRIGPGSAGSILGQDYFAIRNLSHLIDVSNDANGREDDMDLKDLEIWGLTAWMMNVLFVRMGVMNVIEDAAEGCKSLEKDEELVRRLSEGTRRDAEGDVSKCSTTGEVAPKL